MPKSNPRIAKMLPGLHAEGWTDEEIADAVGCHKSSVKRHRNKLHLPANRSKVTRSVRENIDALSKEGVPVEHIAKMTGVAPATAYRYATGPRLTKTEVGKIARMYEKLGVL